VLNFAFAAHPERFVKTAKAASKADRRLGTIRHKTKSSRKGAQEAACVALALGGLADPAKKTTVTVDVISGGERINVVSDRALVKADVRAFGPEEFTRVQARAAAITAHPAIDVVTIKSTLQGTSRRGRTLRPPTVSRTGPSLCTPSLAVP